MLQPCHGLIEKLDIYPKFQGVNYTKDVRGIQIKTDGGQQRDQSLLAGELRKTAWRRWHVSHVVQKERTFTWR